MSGQPVPSPISPAQLSYSGTPFDVVDGSETIPSDYAVVILNVTNGGLTMHGSPVIADGKYVGQRLLISLAEPSNAVTFQGASDNASTLQFLFRNPQVLTASTYGGGDYPAPQGSLELVWLGDRWQAAGFPVAQTLQTQAAIDACSFPGIFAPEAQTDHTWTDLSHQADTLVANGDSFAHNFILSGIPIPMIGTPAIDFAAASGEFILITNDPTSSVSIMFKDDAVLAGTALHLKTPYVDLLPGDALLLRSPPSGGWYEVARTLRSESGSTTFECEGGDTLDNGTGGVSDIVNSFSFGRTLYVTFNSVDVTAGSPSIQNALIDGQELVVMVNPAAANTLTINDDNASPGTNVRLSTTSIVLTAGSSLTVKWNAAATKWFEIARSILA